MSKLDKAGFDATSAEMLDDVTVRVEGDILININLDLDWLVNTPIDGISTEQYRAVQHQQPCDSYSKSNYLLHANRKKGF